MRGNIEGTVQCPLLIGSLFSGIGGLDLGFEKAGFSIAWQVEYDDYCQQVLAKHWPTTLKYKDICELDFSAVLSVEGLIGGFPCQDVSAAGKREGLKDGNRSGLWHEYHRAISTLRPRFALIENVPGLIHRGLDIVLADLASIGYDAEWQCISAAALNAPHIRDRIWIVAYPRCDHRKPLWALPSELDVHYQRRYSQDGVFSHTDGKGLEGRPDFRDNTSSVWPPPQRSNGDNYWQGEIPEPTIHRVDDGVSSQLDRAIAKSVFKARLKALGNAVVPQVAEYVARQIMRWLLI